MPKKLTTEEFIKKAKEVHKNKYDYSKVEYKSSKEKICILYNNKEYFQIAGDHIRGVEPLFIKQKENGAKKSKTNDQFIKEAKEVHGDKYNYSKIKYENTHKKVCILCPEHGEFWQMPSQHLSKKQGCPKCYYKTLNERTKTNDQFIKEAKEVHGDKYNYSKIKYESASKKIKIICEKHGEFWQMPYLHLQKHGCPSCAGSNTQNEINDFIESLNLKIIKNARNIISPKELDIFIPTKNIAIEYNGLFWHSEQQLKKRGVEIPKNYHLKKLEECINNNIRLIQIFEDEWLNKKEIVKNRLFHILNNNNKIIGARKCFLKEIEAKEKNKFLEKHHIQSIDRSSIKLGAFYDNNLIAVMTFCKPRIAMGQRNAKEGTYELSRYATEFNYSFPGLASKMFKFAIKNYNIKEIYTYSDIRWNKFHGTGPVYEHIGMKYIHTSNPNYFYIINNKRVHRFNFRKQELQRKLKIFNEEKTEYQNMLNNGYDRIWDCGNDKYIFTN